MSRNRSLIVIGVLTAASLLGAVVLFTAGDAEEPAPRRAPTDDRVDYRDRQPDHSRCVRSYDGPRDRGVRDSARGNRLAARHWGQ